ncbi:MAG TPA: hypothetical protein VHZ33_04150 [Trebonia sp.]|jgi:hypothetical protein|nr:hypothetical protein [Trebonia sp.]
MLKQRRAPARRVEQQLHRLGRADDGDDAKLGRIPFLGDGHGDVLVRRGHGDAMRDRLKRGAQSDRRVDGRQGTVDGQQSRSRYLQL